MTDLPVFVVESRPAVLVSVFVQPRAAKDEVVGVHGAALKVKVRAAPEGGRANKATCELLGGLLGIAPTRLTVVAGGASRHKKIAVEGMDAGGVAAALEPFAAKGRPA